jgi:hypothetical protein
MSGDSLCVAAVQQVGVSLGSPPAGLSHPAPPSPLWDAVTSIQLRRSRQLQAVVPPASAMERQRLHLSKTHEGPLLHLPGII